MIVPLHFEDDAQRWVKWTNEWAANRMKLIHDYLFWKIIQSSCHVMPLKNISVSEFLNYSCKSHSQIEILIQVQHSLLPRVDSRVQWPVTCKPRWVVRLLRYTKPYFSLIHIRFLKSTVLVDDRVSISLDMHINARLYRHYQPLAHGYTKKASIFVFQLNTTRLMSRPWKYFLCSHLL